MFSRMLAILLSSCLPVLGVILPFSEAHRTNALVAGIAATILGAFSLVDRRARIGAAVVGAWVALSPFVIPSTLLEQSVTVMWGVLMFQWLVGPFSETPQVSFARGRVEAPAPTPARHLEEMPRAA
ncbi:MAG TPA: hypothetical protein VHK47_11705 [Polyangia bacterium]|jgi:hypothetical protein|nr:hypothetical protein [Polyangia bacterium]